MAKQKKQLIRVEELTYTFYYNGKKVIQTQKALIYEDQAQPLNEASAQTLFKQFPECVEIQELHERWGGRWMQSTGRKSTYL